MPNVNALNAALSQGKLSAGRSQTEQNTVFELKGPALQAARRASEAAEVDPKTRQAAQDFEAFFIGHLLKDMRNSLPEGGLFEQSSESRMMHDMLDENMADDLAHKGQGIGLAQVLMKQLQQSRS
jgi:peptidoglycan hydrolase FlgJ